MAGADFGNTIIEGEIAPAVQQQAPVDDKSGQYLAQAADAALQGVGSIFGGMVKQNQQNAADGVLNNYRQEATLLAEGVDQGKIGVAAARGRLRQLYSNAISNNPALGGEIDKLHSSLMDQYGIGSVIKAGNEQTARERDVQDAAFKAGWTAPDGTPDVDGYQQWQRTVTDSENITRDIARRTAQRGEMSALDKEATTKVIHNMATAGYPWVQQQVEKAAKLVDGGADAATVIQQLRADVGAQVNQFTTLSNGEDISYVVQPMKDLLTTFEDSVTNKTGVEIMNAQIANIKARGEYILRSDPEIAKVLAVSELFKQDAGPIIQMKLSSLSAKIFANDSKEYDPASDTNSKPSDVIGQEGDVKASLDTTAELMTNAIKKPTPELEKEVSNQITNKLRALKAYNADNVKDYRNIVDFFAGTAVQKWTESGKLVVPASVREQAADVVQKQYEAVLLPAVKQQWDEVNMMVQNFQPTGDRMIEGGSGKFIEPVWNGTSVSFKALPEFQDNPNIQAQVDSLNKGANGIAGPLNTLIRAKAHINGSTDYKAEWEDLGGRLFGLGEPADGSGSTSGTTPAKVTPENAVDTLGDLSGASNYAAVPPVNEAIAAIEKADLGDFNDEMVSNYINASAGDEDVTPDIADGEEALKGFEGFSSKPYWDVNAYRVGFGSDTITKEDGSVVRVKPGMSVTRQDAQRDLTRRLNQEFIPGIVKLVGDDTWGVLPPAAKTALASIAYNYGSIGPDGANIAKAVATGDLNAIADAVERLKKHNGGVNAKRRQAEANMIRNANG